VTPDTQLTLIRPKRGWIAIDWKELWDYRELLSVLVLRDISVRYKQTVLGVAWAVIQPVFSMVVFSIVFGRLAQMPSDGVPYPVFVYAGLMPWLFFSSAVTNAGSSLLSQQALLTKIYLPRFFVPGSAIGSALVDLAISFAVYLVLMLWYGVKPGWGMLALPGLVLLAVVAALGVGLILAALTVTYRDLRHVVPFLTQVWLYITPVIYPVSMVPERWQWLLALNPMAGVVDGFRSALLGLPWNFTTLTTSAVVSIGLLFYGLFFFRRMERRFADIA
jgi:lipopolysaccharide transport system permease protein